MKKVKIWLFTSLLNRKNCYQQLAAALFALFLSWGASAQNYKTGPNSPLRTFGEKFEQGDQVADQQTRMVFYRTLPTSAVPGAASIYVNGQYHTSLIPGGYNELCVAPGAFELGLKSVTVDREVKDNLDTTTVIQSTGGQSLFFRVQEVGSNRQLLKPVHSAEALIEINALREQTHTISRVTVASVCKFIPSALPKAPSSPPQTLQMTAETFFAFGKSELSAITPPGRDALNAFVASLRDQYSQIDRLHIIGHADPLGQNESNERLSLQRAHTILQYLSQTGLENVRMTSEGRGSREPVVTQCGVAQTPQTIACHAPNRRVNIEVGGIRR